MKRATYTIPLIGFGVTLSACADPIIDEFDAQFVAGIGVPFSYSEVDSTTGVTCTLELNASMSVDAELQAAISVNYSYTCDDGTNESYAETYTGTITVDQGRSKYTIALDLGGEPFTLDCTRDTKGGDRGFLLCADQNGDAWAFAPKE